MKIFIRIFALIGIVLGFTMFIFAVTNDENLYVTNYIYASEKIDSNLDGIKIVQLSDYHNHGLTYKNGNLVDLVNAQEPDYLFLTGDFIDQNSKDKDISDLAKFLDGTKDIPTFYIVGNHEYYASHVSEFYSLIYSHSNVTFLYDNFVKIQHNGSSFNIVGMKDPYLLLKGRAGYSSDDEIEVMEPSFSKLASQLDDEFNILLAHRPDMFKMYNKYNMDLVFSGHTHGEQFSFLHTFEYRSGRYDLDNSTLIVSNGISYSGKWPVRYNCPMQLVTCTLKSA